jgi:hypothetical protein
VLDPREVAIDRARERLLEEKPEARWDEIITQQYGSTPYWDVFFIVYPDYNKVRVSVEEF